MSTSGVEPKNSGDNEHETGSGRDDARTVLWSFSYGSRPNTVRADERYPGSTMRVRYRDPNKSGRDKRAEITVELRVRKSASAAVDPKLESRVKRVIIDMHKRQSAGLLPTENAPSRNRNVPDDSKESLTIEQGFELALHPDTGKYPSTDTRRYQEMKSLRDVILSPGMFPVGLTWAKVEHSHIVSLWRRIAAIHKEDPTRFGPRRAEVIVDALYTVAEWLRTHERIPSDAVKRKKGWRSELQSEWHQITNRAIQVVRPRHTIQESMAIHAALDNPERNRYRELLRVSTGGSHAALPYATRENIVRDEAGRAIGLRLLVQRARRDGTTVQVSVRVHLDDRARAALAPVDTPDAAPDAPLFTAAPHVLEVDPRIELAVKLGAELRLGQVGISRRSQLHLTPEEFAPFGTFKVVSKGKKLGGKTALTEDERKVLDYAFATLLSEAEAAYKEGDLSTDYFLFPHGKLVRGIAPLERAREAPITRDALRKLFRALEHAAGVESVPGRGWYGLRRRAADLTADNTPDADIRALGGGWAPGSSMPAMIYREQETLEKLAKTAVVRRTARAGSTSRAFEARLLASRLSNEAVPDSAGSLLAMLPPELANQVLRHLGVAAPESVASASNAEAGEPQTSTLDVTTEASVGTSVGTNPDSDENAAGD